MNRESLEKAIECAEHDYRVSGTIDPRSFDELIDAARTTLKASGDRAGALAGLVRDAAEPLKPHGNPDFDQGFKCGVNAMVVNCIARIQQHLNDISNQALELFNAGYAGQRDVDTAEYRFKNSDARTIEKALYRTALSQPQYEVVDVELMTYDGNGPGIREGWNSAMSHITAQGYQIVRERV